MSDRIRIADLRDELYDDREIAHAQRFNPTSGRAGIYEHDVSDCPLCALLDAVEAAHQTAEELAGGYIGNQLAKALERFDFT